MDQGENELNERLLNVINTYGGLVMVPAMVCDKYIIRFCVTYQEASEEDMTEAWRIVSACAGQYSSLL